MKIRYELEYKFVSGAVVPKILLDLEFEKEEKEMVMEIIEEIKKTTISVKK